MGEKADFLSQSVPSVPYMSSKRHRKERDQDKERERMQTPKIFPTGTRNWVSQKVSSMGRMWNREWWREVRAPTEQEGTGPWAWVLLEMRFSGSSSSSSPLSSGMASSGIACIWTPGAWGSILRFSNSRCLWPMVEGGWALVRDKPEPGVFNQGVCGDILT